MDGGDGASSSWWTRTGATGSPSRSSPGHGSCASSTSASSWPRAAWRRPALAGRPARAVEPAAAAPVASRRRRTATGRGAAGQAAVPLLRRAARTRRSSTSGCRRCARATSTAAELDRMEPFYPLHVYVCGSCFLVQLQQYVSAEEIFTEYAYFSSYSDSWVDHARRYVDQMIERLRPRAAVSLVVELASNDGYLLQHFVAAGRPRPRHRAGRQRGRGGGASGACRHGSSSSASRRAGQLLAEERAGRPDRRQQRAGPGPRPQRLRRRASRSCSRPSGVVTVEFPHLLRLIEENQFDTIYHEHFSYFSLLTAERIFAAHGLTVFDVEELPTHGGSLRVYARHAERRGQAGHRTGRGAAPTRSWTTASTGSSYYRRFGQQVQRDQAPAARVPDRRQGRGQVHRRLRRPRQGQHAAELLRHPHRLPRLHGRPQPLQAGPVPARHPHPDPAPGPDRARPGPTTC